MSGYKCQNMRNGNFETERNKYRNGRICIDPDDKEKNFKRTSDRKNLDKSEKFPVPQSVEKRLNRNRRNNNDAPNTKSMISGSITFKQPELL